MHSRTPWKGLRQLKQARACFTTANRCVTVILLNWGHLASWVWSRCLHCGHASATAVLGLVPPPPWLEVPSDPPDGALGYLFTTPASWRVGRGADLFCDEGAWAGADTVAGPALHGASLPVVRSTTWKRSNRNANRSRNSVSQTGFRLGLAHSPSPLESSYR